MNILIIVFLLQNLLDSNLVHFLMFCEGNMHVIIDIIFDTYATKEAVIQAGTAILQYIYRGPDSTMSEIRYNMFSRREAEGMIKPETRPLTEGTATQHSLHTYLQTWDCILP